MGMTKSAASELFDRNGLPLDDAALDRLLEFERLLLGWNEKVNLVSRKDASGVFVRQIVGSAAFLFRHALEERTTLLDVGTGGGLPGIPVAIIHPSIEVTLVDSIAKKIRAVSDIVAGLGLTNVRTICSRVESLPTRERGAFDYIVARGVSRAAEVVEWCLPLVRRAGAQADRSASGPADRGAGPERGGAERRAPLTGPRTPVPRGSFILLKGGDLDEEIAALSDVVPGASVTIRSIEVEGDLPQFTEKKIIIIIP